MGRVGYFDLFRLTLLFLKIKQVKASREIKMSKFELNFNDFYNEEWKEIEGFENYYVSNYGRVSNFNYRNTGDRILMKPFNTKQGYYQIALVDRNGKRVKKLIHRLVAEAFIPNPKNKSEVDHIDTNRYNNIVDNLRWTTREENYNNPKSHINRVNGQKNKTSKIK